MVDFDQWLVALFAAFDGAGHKEAPAKGGFIFDRGFPTKG
jgi:hypothetical protein